MNIANTASGFLNEKTPLVMYIVSDIFQFYIFVVNFDFSIFRFLHLYKIQKQSSFTNFPFKLHFFYFFTSLHMRFTLIPKQNFLWLLMAYKYANDFSNCLHRLDPVSHQKYLEGLLQI